MWDGNVTKLETVIILQIYYPSSLNTEDLMKAHDINLLTRMVIFLEDTLRHEVYRIETND